MSGGHHTMHRAIAAIVALLAIAVLAIACASSDTSNPSSDPPGTTAHPGNAKLPALPTRTCTPCPIATATGVEGPSAISEAPTAIATAEPTVEPTSMAASWPTVEPDVCPLTGLPVSDPALLQRRPLAIKVQNASISRPQYGLPQADIVYEHLSEAGITRFTALYLCQDVKKVGSTRSARFIDLEIPAMYKSLLAFSGTSAGLYPKFLNTDFYDREFCYGWGLHAEGFYRDKDLRAQGVPIEHTLFADPVKIWQIADELKINEPQELRSMHFSSEVPAGGQPATHIEIPYPSRDMVVDYRYDPDLGAYLRWDGGEPHIDAGSGEQISVTNVIVLYATHVDTDIYEDEPRRNHPSVQIQLWGTGPAVIFRDGQAFEGLWARPKRDDMVVFRDATGQAPIPLKPGNTWIHTVPLPGHRWSFNATWDTEE